MKATPQQANEVADQFFACIERQDVEALANYYTQDAVVWKNYNQIAIPASESLEFLKGVGDYLRDVRYKDVRRNCYEGGFTQQHVFTGIIRETGETLAIPVCVIAQVEDGRVKRIDEYLDSAHRLPVRV